MKSYGNWSLEWGNDRCFSTLFCTAYIGSWRRFVEKENTKETMSRSERNNKGEKKGKDSNTCTRHCTSSDGASPRDIGPRDTHDLLLYVAETGVAVLGALASFIDSLVIRHTLPSTTAYRPPLPSLSLFPLRDCPILVMRVRSAHLRSPSASTDSSMN